MLYVNHTRQAYYNSQIVSVCRKKKTATTQGQKGSTRKKKKANREKRNKKRTEARTGMTVRQKK